VNRIRWAILVASLAGLGAAASLFIASCTTQSTTATSTPPAMTHDQLVARGRVISFSSGCNDCHTPGSLYGAPDTTRLLSGSELGWQGPWGVSYPRNLTPDPETGIASWTEDDIIAAVRTGHRPDGTILLPPMPWPFYAFMSDDDVHALAAFIKTLPPVKHQAPKVVPPGVKPTGAYLTFPPPPAWDAMNLPPPAPAVPKAGGSAPPPAGK